MANSEKTFSKGEIKIIHKLASAMRGKNTPLEDEAEECKNAFRDRQKKLGGLDGSTAHSLAVAYRVFLRCEQDGKGCIKLLKALKIESKLKTSGKRLNAIIKASTTRETKYASKLTMVIRLAIGESVAPNKFEDFISKSGGVGKCIKMFKDMRRQEGVADFKIDNLVIKNLKVKIEDELISEKISGLLEKARLSGKNKSKFCKLIFCTDGSVKLASFEDAPFASIDSPAPSLAA